MSRFSFNFQSAYRLRPAKGQADELVSQVQVEGAVGQTALLPYSSGLSYVVVPATSKPLSIEAEDFRIERLDPLTTLWLRLRLALLFKKKKYLEFREFAIFSNGVKRQRKRFTTFNQHMFKTGVALDSAFVTQHPEVLTGWAPLERYPLKPNSEAHVETAIVAHIYYEDTWPDFAEVLKRVTIPFDLIVTTAPGREQLIEAILREFPDADIEVVENRGRDIGPFLLLLERGRFDRYRWLCKVHGKKSSDGGRISYLGTLWRRRLLFDLLAGPDIAQTIVKAFKSDPKLGMVGPAGFRMPSGVYDEKAAWGEGNRENILKLAGLMGVPEQRFTLDFYGGTMFWVRPEALKPLRELGLTSKLAEEKGQLDGTVAHGIERVFTTSALQAGYRLADSDGYHVRR